MRKILRILSVFGFSLIVFLIFATTAGIIRVRGAGTEPVFNIHNQYTSQSSDEMDELGIDLPSDPKTARSPSAPTADVDLQVTLADFPDPVIAGNIITYTIGILNNSPQTATLVTLTDTLPLQVSFLAAIASQGSCTGPVCDLGTLLGGSSANVTLTGVVDSSSSGALINQVEVSSFENELVPADNIDSEQTAVTQEADLSIVKLDDPDPVFAGAPLTYTLIITNHGPSDAIGVMVNDNFPTNILNFINAPPYCTRVGPDIDCQLGDLVAGKSTPPVILRMSVKSGATNPLNNTATVSSSTPDPDPSNDQVTENTTIDFSADLSVTTVDNPDPVAAGGTLTYILTITNSGPSDADGVVVTDTLPTEVSLTSFTTSQGSCFVITCTLGTIAAGGSVNVTVVGVVDAAASGSIMNSADVSSNVTDPDTTNNQDNESTTIQQSADLSISTVDNPDPVVAGGTLTYILTIDNSGPSNAGGVVVTETLSAEVSLTSITPSQGTCAGTVCTLGTIPQAGSATVTVVGDVNAAATGSIMNTAEVSSNTTDPDTSNNQDNESTTIQQSADLSISTVANPDPVAPGGNLTYILTITNNGPSNAAGVVVTDTLPTEVSLTSITASQGSCAGTVCTLGTIVPAGSATVTVVGTVDVAATGNIMNSADVSSNATDPDTSNNQDNVITAVLPSADLSVSKRGSSNPVDPDETLTYAITVTNKGPFDASGVTLTDTLPTEVNLTSITPSQGSCAGTVCTLGTIAMGNSAQVILVGLININAPEGTITNTAQVSSDLYDPIPGNNIGRVFTTIGPGVDLSITKTASPDPVTAGETLTYNLTVDNPGPSMANNVSVIDTLPESVNFVSSTPGVPTCAETSGVVSCNLGNLASMSTKSVTIVVQVNASATGSLTNQADVLSNTYDPDESDNQSLQTTQLETSADLSLSILDDPDPVSPGDILNYTINFNNNGPSVSRDVELTVTLPISASLISMMPGAPACTQDQGDVVCSFGDVLSGAGIQVELGLQVDNDASGTLNLQTTLFSSTADPDGTNNNASETTTIFVPDMEPPSVKWVSPVGNEQRFDVGSEIITLEVDASDNVGIEQVDFKWWDYKYNDYEGRFIDISVFEPPYSIEFDTRMLYYGYNHIYVRAFDTSRNPSKWGIWIFLYRYDYKYLPMIAR